MLLGCAYEWSAQLRFLVWVNLNNDDIDWDCFSLLNLKIQSRKATRIHMNKWFPHFYPLRKKTSSHVLNLYSSSSYMAGTWNATPTYFQSSGKQRNQFRPAPEIQRRKASATAGPAILLSPSQPAACNSWVSSSLCRSPAEVLAPEQPENANKTFLTFWHKLCCLSSSCLTNTWWQVQDRWYTICQSYSLKNKLKAALLKWCFSGPPLPSQWGPHAWAGVPLRRGPKTPSACQHC